jgi:DME family drug/metabolite transporter
VCIVAAVRQIPASRAAIVATLEPVLAAAVAWVVHGESLAAVQIGGGLLVVAAVVWVQAQALSFEAEAAPAPRAVGAPRPDARARA